MSSEYPTPHELERTGLPLPAGIAFRALTTHRDSRGDLTELNRISWGLAPSVQWVIVHSRSNVLRGVHVHRVHTDLLTVTAGEIILGLQDLRSAAPTHGVTAMIRLSFNEPCVVVIPPGVAHGLYVTRPSCHLIGTTHEFDGSDDLGCHWGDPALSMRWPGDDPELSPRDRDAGSFAEMVALLTA